MQGFIRSISVSGAAIPGLVHTLLPLPIFSRSKENLSQVVNLPAQNFLQLVEKIGVALKGCDKIAARIVEMLARRTTTCCAFLRADQQFYLQQKRMNKAGNGCLSASASHPFHVIIINAAPEGARA